MWRIAEKMCTSKFYRNSKGIKESYQTAFGMNTEISCKVYGNHARKVANSIIVKIKRLENKLSRYKANSEIGKLNKSAGKGAVKISTETYVVLSSAIQYSKITEGLFNIMVCPLVELWDYKHAMDIPEELRIRQVMSLVDYHDLELDMSNKTAKFRKPDQSIDLGAIGKGFASDCCIDLLKKKGIASAFINIGGNVSVLGNKPDGSPWRVGIRHPRNSGSLIGAIEVFDKAVVTSGDYERYFVDSMGKRRHHILNPINGYPADSGLISVTVVAKSAMEADALSTAIFVAGIEKGLIFLEQSLGAEAVLMDQYQQVYITQGLERCFLCTEDIMVNVIGREKTKWSKLQREREKSECGL